jgi:hypothetical protein
MHHIKLNIRVQQDLIIQVGRQNNPHQDGVVKVLWAGGK